MHPDTATTDVLRPAVAPVPVSGALTIGVTGDECSIGAIAGGGT
jgi:hypothetical protein